MYLNESTVPGEERAATWPSDAKEESEREEEERGRGKTTFSRSSLTHELENNILLCLVSSSKFNTS
jgi:hypothetical protein